MKASRNLGLVYFNVFHQSCLVDQHLISRSYFGDCYIHDARWRGAGPGHSLTNLLSGFSATLPPCWCQPPECGSAGATQRNHITELGRDRQMCSQKWISQNEYLSLTGGQKYGQVHASFLCSAVRLLCPMQPKVI